MYNKKIIICDLDNTLANAEHRMYLVEGKHKNYDEFNKLAKNDMPKEIVCDVVRQLSKNHLLLILSGRSESVRSDTEEWLKDNDIEPTWLILRGEKDFRPAETYKSEKLIQFLTKNQYTLDDIYCAFDDEEKIYSLWKRMSITCFLV